VRWMRPDTYHVTLRFLGDVEPDAVAAALDAVPLPTCDVALGTTLRRLGRDALVVDAQGLDRLAATVRAATAPVVADDGRPFTGHLTVARRAEGVRERGALPIQGFLPDGLRFPATQVGLATSRTLPSGAVHTIVRTWPTVRGGGRAAH
jgi:2'-5' RNA ligase